MFSNRTLNHAASHAENRERICLFCLKKAKLFIKIKGALLIKVNVFVSIQNNDYLPNVLCNSCKVQLYALKKEDDYSKLKSKLPNYSVFKGPTVQTRSRKPNQNTNICNCYLCDYVRQLDVPLNFLRKKTLNNHTKKIEPDKFKKKNLKMIKSKKCPKCLSELKKGKNHKCNLENHITNLKNHIEKALPAKQKDQLILSLLKDKVQENTKNGKKVVKDTDIVMSQSKGKPLKLTLKPMKKVNKENKRRISAEDLAQMQDGLHLSFRKTKSLVSSLRYATKEKTLFEPMLEEKLLKRNRIVNDFFEIKSVNILNLKGKIIVNTEKKIIFCTDLGKFIQFIENKRNVNEMMQYKFGVDGGGGFLKFCLTIQSCNTQNVDDTLKTMQFKDAGAKKLFIIAIAPDCQENYSNLLEFWSKLDLNQFIDFISADLKLVNILLGMMSHSCTNPCAWCDTDKNNLNTLGSCRTTQSLLESFKEWQLAGAQKNEAKRFKSCIHPPLLDTSVDWKILDIVPPPELHLMLGAVNTIINHMAKDCEKHVTHYTDKICHVQKEITRGGCGFAGNACKTLLEKADLLRLLSESTSCLKCVKWVEALTDLRSVVHDCFGNILRCSFKDSISRFRKSYLKLSIPITPKIHVIFFHVAEFCEKNGRALGSFSEQAFEAVHHDFNETWKKYKLKKGHPKFSENLLKAVVEYNSHHV